VAVHLFDGEHNQPSTFNGSTELLNARSIRFAKAI
jgi:hypothetical protein